MDKLSLRELIIDIVESFVIAFIPTFTITSLTFWVLFVLSFLVLRYIRKIRHQKEGNFLTKPFGKGLNNISMIIITFIIIFTISAIFFFYYWAETTNGRQPNIPSFSFLEKWAD